MNEQKYPKDYSRYDMGLLLKLSASGRLDDFDAALAYSAHELYALELGVLLEKINKNLVAIEETKKTLEAYHAVNDVLRAQHADLIKHKPPGLVIAKE